MGLPATAEAAKRGSDSRLTAGRLQLPPQLRANRHSPSQARMYPTATRASYMGPPEAGGKYFRTSGRGKHLSPTPLSMLLASTHLTASLLHLARRNSRCLFHSFTSSATISPAPPTSTRERDQSSSVFVSSCILYCPPSSCGGSSTRYLGRDRSLHPPPPFRLTKAGLASLVYPHPPLFLRAIPSSPVPGGRSSLASQSPASYNFLFVFASFYNSPFSPFSPSPHSPRSSRFRPRIMGLAYNIYLNSNKIYGCKSCKTHLANHEDIISRVRQPLLFAPSLQLPFTSPLRAMPRAAHLHLSDSLLMS